jgi:DNA-binding HxlR family transcriptional regulator
VVSALQGDLDRSLFTALAGRRMTQSELKAWLLLGSGSALHRHLGGLLELGLLEKRSLEGAPRRVEYGLTAAGLALAEVGAAVESWLGRHPERPLELVGELGWRAFVALNEGWDSALLGRAVAAPRSRRELLEAADRRPERLRRHLRRLAGAGLLESAGSGGRDDAVLPTQWCRLGFGPLAAALRWERAHFPARAAAIPAPDAVLALAGILPLARPAGGLAGTCALTVRGDATPASPRRAGAAWARVGAGRVLDCGPGPLGEQPDAWVDGELEGWFEAVLDGSRRRLRIGGDAELAGALIAQLHHQVCVSEEPASLGTDWYRLRAEHRRD